MNRPLLVAATAAAASAALGGTAFVNPIVTNRRRPATHRDNAPRKIDALRKAKVRL